MAFFCSICGEESTRICVRCTKDTCSNHLCDKCLCCSDCCECELTLSDNGVPAATARSVFPRTGPEPAPQQTQSGFASEESESAEDSEPPHETKSEDPEPPQQTKSGFPGDPEEPESPEPVPNPEPDPTPPEPDPV